MSLHFMSVSLGKEEVWLEFPESLNLLLLLSDESSKYIFKMGLGVKI